MALLGKQAYRKSKPTAISTQNFGCANWRIALERMEGAYSANTIRSYRADFTIFTAWCKYNSKSVFPATPEVVAEFVLAQSKISSPATVSRRCAAIVKIHRLLGFENPCRSEVVNIALRRVFRQQSRRQNQALGLTNNLKQELIRHCPNSLQGLRDRALITTGYDTLCRRAELVLLQIEDLLISPDCSGSVLSRRSKSDQCGDGRLCYLSSETVSALRRWLEAAKLNAGPIFRGIRGTAPLPVALHPYSVVRIIKRYAAAANLAEITISRLSGHSMRVGAAQDMATAGIDLGAIMHAGGWKSPHIVMRYIEYSDINKSGMARLYSRSFPSKV